MENCCSGTSVAHTYGNMTTIIKNYVKNLYPKNYFETEFISSSIGYKQFRPLRQKNKEFLKKKKPMLIIKPRINVNDEDKFLFGTMLTERIYDHADVHDFGNLQPFFDDREKGLFINYLLNRMKMTFDVVIIHGSMMEQINMESYIRNRVRINHNFTLPVFLESYIPKSILKVLSEQANIPMVNDGKVTRFLDYLNGHSVQPVTYKLQDSTGNDEFFRFYQTNVDTVITNLDIDDGNKRGHVYDTFTTNFTITTEFWGAGLYYIFSEKPIPVKYENNPEIDDSSHIIPLFSFPTYTIKAPENWTTYSSTFYRVDSSVREDITDFSTVVGVTLDKVIEYHRENHIPLDILLTETIMMDDEFLVKGKDYEIDYSSYTIITKKLNATKTYRLIIFINTQYMNELKIKLFGLKTE